MKKGLTLLVFFIFLYAASCLAEESYYLITFSGPVMQEWKDQLAEFGVVFSSYIPDYSFVVMMNDSVKKNIEALDFVSSLSLYNPKSKFSSSLLSKRSSQKSKFYVFLHDSTKLEEVSDELLRLGVEVLSSSEGKLKVSALYSQLDLLSSIDSVSWVEEVPRYVLVNDVAANIISANFTWDSYNLTGSNLTVAISDSGLDTGFDDNMSLDFKGKVVMFNWWGSTPDDTNGHGTHTAGSLAGSGNYSYNQFKGMAYDANIVFQAIGDDEGTDTVYPPDPISELFIEAYNNNARVHSNSWGSTSNLGEYTSDSQSIDDFTWNYTDFVIVFAAGNMGGSGLGTVEFPSTAKNGLSIGATGNRAGNVDQVASFSSRGPCDDGRIKPDLVAPGYSVVSTKSTLGGTSCTSSYELNGNYSYCSGTSMATPIAGGAAAIVINHYQSSGVNPSAALVKATLINGAMDIGYGIPSNYSGWGRINLSESLNPPKPKTINYTDYTSGLSTGESSSYSYIVYNDSVPLKVTLVWTDYPSDLSAVKNLVNDLNLVVVSPDGSVFNGNDNKDALGDEFDNTNNVEQVNISNLSIGSYIVNVSAFNIPNGPQPFALVVSGPINDFPPVVSLFENNTNFNSSRVRLNFTLDEDYYEANCSLFIDNVFNQTGSFQSGDNYFDLNLSNGSYVWYVQCNDTSSSSDSQIFSFTVDTSISVSISSPQNITYSSTSINLIFSAESLSLDSCWYNFGDDNNITLPSCSNAILSVNESSYLLYLFANNSDGDESVSSVEFRTDLTYPEISLVSPSDGSTWSSSNDVMFVFNVSDVEVSNCSLIVNDSVVATSTSVVIGENSFTQTLSNAVYNWSVNCSDAASNINNSQTYSVTVGYSVQTSSPSGGGGGGGGTKTVASCVESWTCSPWSECVDMTQKRVCTELNGCGTAERKPTTSRACIPEMTLEKPSYETTGAATAPSFDNQSEKTVQYPRRYDYTFNKLFFYGPISLITIILLAYIFYVNILKPKIMERKP